MEALSVRIETRVTEAQVWDVLTDADGYALWVPEATGVDGEVSHGQWIILHRAGTDRDQMLHITTSPDRRLLRWEAAAPLGMVSERCTFTLSVSEPGGHCAVEIERGVGGPLERLLGDGPEAQRGWLNAVSAGLRTVAERRAGLPGNRA